MTNVKVVIGSNHGDEGKGLMADYFCNEAIKRKGECVVVCSNGGAQRGHTVTTPDGIRHVFHHFGSGTLVGADTYLSEDFILNPMVFRKEYEELRSLGVKPLVYRNRNCRWTTPFDMIINQITEEHRGENKHGSCGLGIWETICRNSPVRIDDFRDFQLLKQHLHDIRTLCVHLRLKELHIEDIDYEWKKIIYSDALIDKYVDDFIFMVNHTFSCCDDMLEEYEEIVFENGQGLLLDQNIEGYGEHTTPSNTGIKNPAKIILGVIPEAKVEVCYVTRTYLTRHGAGRLDGECDVRDINPLIYDETNVPNIHQGAIRYGKIDVEELVDRVEDDFTDWALDDWTCSLAITHCNETGWNFATKYGKIDVNSEKSFKKVYLSDGKTRKSIKII